MNGETAAASVRRHRTNLSSGSFRAVASPSPARMRAPRAGSRTPARPIRFAADVARPSRCARANLSPARDRPKTSHQFNGLDNSAALRLAALAKRPAPRHERAPGEMAEWLKAHAWKACVRETVPWVRIPLSPPEHRFKAFHLIPISAINRSNNNPLQRGWVPLRFTLDRHISRLSVCTVICRSKVPAYGAGIRKTNGQDGRAFVSERYAR